MKGTLNNVERSTEITSGSLELKNGKEVSSFKSLAPLNTTTNREIIFPERNHVFIDYVTLSIRDITDHVTYFKWVNHHLKSFGLRVSERRTAIPIGYDIAYQICCESDSNFVCGSIKFSNALCRILIELTGEGCAMAERFDSFNWINVLVAQERVHLKRIDLTYDDFEGGFSIEKVDKAHSRGSFNSVTGRRPVKINLGDKQNGRTRQIGGRSAYKQVCIYEKAKQLNIRDPKFKNWVRIEARFNSNSRDSIPKEILQFKTNYFYSAYPRAFSSLVKNARYTSVVHRESIVYVATLSRSVMYSRHQYGKINQELVNVVGEKKAINLLTRPGKSQKVKRLPFITNEYINEKFDAVLVDIAMQTPV